MRLTNARKFVAAVAIVTALLFALPASSYAQAPLKGWAFTYWQEAAHIHVVGYWEKDCYSQDVEKWGNVLSPYWTGQDVSHCNG